MDAEVEQVEIVTIQEQTQNLIQELSIYVQRDAKRGEGEGERREGERERERERVQTEIRRLACQRESERDCFARSGVEIGTEIGLRKIISYIDSNTPRFN